MSKKISFEEAFSRLEEITQIMETGKITLEESTQLYEEGMKLIEICNKQLNRSEQKIRQITKNDQGSFDTTDFQISSDH